MVDQIADIEDNCNQDEICEHILNEYPDFEKYMEDGTLKKVAEFQERLENHWEGVKFVKGVKPIYTLKGKISKVVAEIKKSSLPKDCIDYLIKTANEEMGENKLDNIGISQNYSLLEYNLDDEPNIFDIFYY
jgi:hypothetical protein